MHWTRPRSLQPVAAYPKTGKTTFARRGNGGNGELILEVLRSLRFLCVSKVFFRIQDYSAPPVPPVVPPPVDPPVEPPKLAEPDVPASSPDEREPDEPRS
jgi:hypothetical protein